MPKHKQKAKKHNFNTSYRKHLVAAAAFVLVATPASWLMVSAQSNPNASPFGSASSNQATDAGAAAGKPGSSSGDAGAKSSGSSTSDKTSTAKQAEAAKKTAASKAASDASSAKTTSPAPAVLATPKPTPTPTPVAPASFGQHTNIISTVFWVGEPADASNANISNAESAWDGNWQTHFGGFDDPDHRNGYNPAGFTPSENPFYFALPYNDLDENGNRKASASNCPNVGASVSWCKNGWIKIAKGSKTAYAQWQDVGPLQEDDTNYVFGTSAPKNTWGAKAGVDVSPAVRDYLGLGDVDRVTWSFIGASSVPAGPWKTIVTTSPGGW